MNVQQLKYPIGKYVPTKNPDGHQIAEWIADIEEFPSKVEKLTRQTTVDALNWKYRPDGWSVKQVIHHCADSHMNSLMRFKLALTEENPAIKPYMEDRWANLADSLSDDITDSLMLLKSLHKKWTMLLRNLSKEQLRREFVHPEQGKKYNLIKAIEMYAWHCNHHLEHIRNGLDSQGKYNRVN